LRRGFVLALVAAFTTLTGRAHAADENTFNARCATCHQQNAQGLPGMYPPLADSIGNELRLKRGREYLIEVVLNGMAGSIEVNGTTYVGLMPEFASLSDGEIAATLNQVLTKFNAGELPKDFAPITAAEVHAARARKIPATKMPDERKSLMDELRKADASDGAAK
jgi:mono/diheme cytochrome c family protein